MSNDFIERAPPEPIPEPAEQLSAIDHIGADHRAREAHQRFLRGSTLVWGSLAAAGVIVYGAGHNERVTHEMPFSHEAQTVVESIDTGLEGMGAVGFPLALGAIGMVKLGASRRPKLSVADRMSSREMTVDHNHSKGLVRRAARKIPVIPAVGVALGALTAGISTEISDGPTRPITVMEQFAPGNMVVQYPGAMPMTESRISRRLSAALWAAAQKHGVKSHALDLDLGVLNYRGQTLSTLALGVETSATSPIHWNSAEGRRAIPILVDESAHISIGSEVKVDGITADVVGQLKDTSAINRVGFAMDGAAMKEYVEQDPQAPDYAVTLETDKKTANEILAEANQKIGAPATVITPEQFKRYSRIFWEANVKPITNVLALASGAMALISMAGAMSSRLIRNRSGWATKLAAGISVNQLRATEVLRSTKDGVTASLVGASAAVVATPAVNFLESGMKAGIGYKEVMIAFGLGTVGSVAGGLSKLIRIQKTINPREHTRV